MTGISTKRANRISEDPFTENYTHSRLREIVDNAVTSGFELLMQATINSTHCVPEYYVWYQNTSWIFGYPEHQCVVVLSYSEYICSHDVRKLRGCFHAEIVMSIDSGEIHIPYCWTPHCGSLSGTFINMSFSAHDICPSFWTDLISKNTIASGFFCEPIQITGWDNMYFHSRSMWKYPYETLKVGFDFLGRLSQSRLHVWIPKVLVTCVLQKVL